METATKEENHEKESSMKQVRHQRKLRNYLINKRFQLKYTLMITGLCTILVILLGIPLYKTVADASDQLVAQVLGDSIYASDSQVELLKNNVEKDKQKTIAILVVFLFTLLLGLTLSSIYVTHKIAGPMYKMMKLFGEIQGNNLHIEGKLRKGDELVELFQAFDDMVKRLRESRMEEIATLSEIIEQIKTSPGKGNLKESIENLEKIRDKMQLSLK